VVASEIPAVSPKGIAEHPHRGDADVGGDVAVDVAGDADGGVAQYLRDHLEWDAVGEHGALNENRTHDVMRRNREVCDLGEQVELALRTRDAAIQRTERRAGELLSKLTRDYGLSMERALEVAGDAVSRADGLRLRRKYERSATS
jgi:hypothetical protein